MQNANSCNFCIKGPSSIQGATPTLLLINKVDLVNPTQLAKIVRYWTIKVKVDAIIPISALQAFNTAQVLERILAYLPEHPPYYPKDMLTDKPARFFAAEIIREQLLRNYHQEIPYSVEVVIEAFKEEQAIVRISATIYVERPSQKAILIGSQGAWGCVKRSSYACNGISWDEKGAREKTAICH